MSFMQFAKPWSWFRSKSAAPARTTVSVRGAAATPASISSDAPLALMPDGEPLRALAGLTGAAPTAQMRRAQQRVAQLVDSGAIDFASLGAAAGPSDALLSIAALCGDPGMLQHAFEAVDDPARLEALAADAPSSRVRQQAALKIADPTALKHLQKRLRGKDKSVYKIVQGKLDGLRAAEQRTAQRQREVEAACSAFERHARRTYDAQYESMLRILEAQWRDLEQSHAELTAAAELQARVVHATSDCRAVIAAHHEQLAQQATAAAARAALDAARREARTQAEATLQEQRAAATAAANETAAADAAVGAEEEQLRAARATAEARALREIGALLGRINGALRDGNTGRASGLRRALEPKLAAAPAVPAYLANQVQQLDAKLNEFKEWKEHAVAPKRAELIEEMEALIGSTEDPQDLATRIKQLQEDWQTISRGVVSDSAADWERFHQASVAAFQPCRDHFAAQARIRDDNLQQRKLIVERLQAFAAVQASAPDYQTIATVLREARQEWRSCFPVDRAAGAPAQETFNAALARLQERLDAWHAQNGEAKRALIQCAEQLATQDGRDNVDRIKRLQMEWKAIGSAARDQDQALWLAFRERCDAVFEQRERDRTEYMAALDANKARAVALCDEVLHSAALTGDALATAVARIPDWQEAFAAIGDLPRAEQYALRERFERGVQQCRIQVAKQRRLEHEAGFDQLFEAARRIQLYGWSRLQAAAPAVRDAFKAAAEQFVAEVSDWPKGGAHALSNAWAAAETSDADVAGRETALRILCIRGEILCEQATPEQDQELRRDHQMQRLVQGLGHGVQTRGVHTSGNELDALAFEWLAVGPVDPAHYATLTSRFRRLRSPAAR